MDQHEISEHMQAARAALKDGDTTRARDLIAPAFAARPKGVAALLLSRVEAAEGKLDAAMALVEQFLEARPDHEDALALRAQLERQRGEAQLPQLVAKVAAGGPEALAAARALASQRPARFEAAAPADAWGAYVHHAPDIETAVAMQDATLIELALEPRQAPWSEAVAAFRVRHDAARLLTVLRPLAEWGPGGMAAFFAARAAFELGDIEAADGLLKGFCAARPSHMTAQVMQAEVMHLKGQSDAARARAQGILEQRPDFAPALRLLARIADDATTQAALPLIEYIDQHCYDARFGTPTPEFVRAAQAMADLTPRDRWQDDPVHARIAHFHFADDLSWAIRNYDPHMIEVSVEFDYMTWPRRIQPYVRGKTVVDVGCGFGGYGTGFLAAGAKHYAGLDPEMDLFSSAAKNKRLRQWSDMVAVPDTIVKELPAIRLFNCTAEKMPLNEPFDTISLHNVTEHLLQLDLVFSGLLKLCHDETRVVFLHHNYYCWNGHHFVPSRPEMIDPSSSEQAGIIDWLHIDTMDDVPDDHYWRTGLNRVRLDEIKAITERYFEIEIWDEIASSPSTVARLTPDIIERVRRKLPDITERELTTNVVFCVARRRT